MEPLLAYGIVSKPYKKGNAWVYAIDRRHPVVQLLTMLDVVLDDAPAELTHRRR